MTKGKENKLHQAPSNWILEKSTKGRTKLVCYCEFLAYN